MLQLKFLWNTYHLTGPGFLPPTVWWLTWLTPSGMEVEYVEYVWIPPRESGRSVFTCQKQFFIRTCPRLWWCSWTVIRGWLLWFKITVLKVKTAHSAWLNHHHWMYHLSVFQIWIPYFTSYLQILSLSYCILHHPIIQYSIYCFLFYPFIFYIPKMHHTIIILYPSIWWIVDTCQTKCLVHFTIDSKRVIYY